MNRYRTIPGLGPQKASATTTCQKCLKKDSYECKAGALDRPYISRPSRTQQFLNPKLKPRLNTDTPNDLLRRQGVADEELAKAQNARDARTNDEPQLTRTTETNRSRSPRSRSPLSSVDSVSTISTNQSDSRERHGRSARTKRRKRSRGELSPASQSKSPSVTGGQEYHKARRYRSRSPYARGRSYRRENRRSTSRSPSQSRSAANKNRRSLDHDNNSHITASLSDQTNKQTFRKRSEPTQDSQNGDSHRDRYKPAPKRERSLSPYSRRLALTQAMNMNR